MRNKSFFQFLVLLTSCAIFTYAFISYVKLLNKPVQPKIEPKVRVASAITGGAQPLPNCIQNLSISIFPTSINPYHRVTSSETLQNGQIKGMGLADGLGQAIYSSGSTDYTLNVVKNVQNQYPKKIYEFISKQISVPPQGSNIESVTRNVGDNTYVYIWYFSTQDPNTLKAWSFFTTQNNLNISLHDISQNMSVGSASESNITSLYNNWLSQICSPAPTPQPVSEPTPSPLPPGSTPTPTATPQAP